MFGNGVKIKVTRFNLINYIARVKTVSGSGRLSGINLNARRQTFELISLNHPLTQTVLTHRAKYK